MVTTGAAESERATVRWYRSFYVRIGFTFALFVIGLLVLQGVVFNAVRMRAPLRNRSPNTVVAIVAADLGSVLRQDPRANIDDYLKQQYAQAQPIYVVMRDGWTASNRSAPLAADIRHNLERMLTGTRGGEVDPQVPVPFVTAPVQVGDALRGIVVLPPAGAPGPFARDMDRLASIPGTALLVLLTIVAAAVVFAPARRRLKSLQAASVRLGSGDLTARAPATDGDEVAEVANAFNRMAEELAVRDEALRTSDICAVKCWPTCRTS
jgi:methyl-accepting chemotaxis protein